MEIRFRLIRCYRERIRFKIDLIVWKFFFVCLSCSRVVVFKIDLIVWKCKKGYSEINKDIESLK